MLSGNLERGGPKSNRQSTLVVKKARAAEVPMSSSLRTKFPHGELFKGGHRLHESLEGKWFQASKQPITFPTPKASEKEEKGTQS